MLALRSSSSFKFIAAFAALAIASGCATRTTKPEPSQPSRPSQPQAPPIIEKTPGPQANLPVPTPVPTPPPAPPSTPPTFLGKELPKVGLILGPGGMKTFAHIGALREISKARIPVHAVAGLEWGAVMGSLFASQGQVNDAEWKAMKLKEEEVVAEGGFLNRGGARSIGAASEFLDTVFGNAQIERSKVKFACPAYWSRQDRFGWLAKGSAKEAMRACVPYPPLYTDNAGVVAAPFSVEDAAQWLRSQGANLIVLVNVLGAGEFLPEKNAGEHAVENLLWSEIRREMMKAKSPTVHFVINVNTSGHPMNDYDGRRALMDAGSKAASETVKKMVSQYGF